MSLVTDFTVMIFLLFFILRDGDRMLKKASEYVPLRDNQKARIFDQFRTVFRSVVVGNLLTALAQGIVGGTGLGIAGFSWLLAIPLTAISSFIPLLGTGLVFIPATGYLLLTGEWQWALFVAAWAFLLVNPIDNYLRPFFMSGPAQMPTVYLFLALVGGLLFFGAKGLIYGPLIFGMAVVILNIYREEFLP
jgi:predicted PurR-regulated permease PerM